MTWKTDLRERCFQFGVVLLKMYPRLCKINFAYAHIGLQLFRAGSSIGAQLEEGDVANSKRDMGAKHAIALREAKEARYWLRYLLVTNVLPDDAKPLYREADEFVAMLTTSVKKLRRPQAE